MTNVNDIIERNMKIVPFVINRMGLGRKIDDYIDVGWIGLIYGAKHYDSSKGKESTILYKSVQYAIFHQLDYERRRKCEVLSFDYQINDDNFYNFVGKDYMQDIFNNIVYRDAINICLDRIDNKNHKEHKARYSEVISDYYGFGREKLSISKLCKKHHISSTMVSLIKKNFKKELKKELGLEEYENGNKTR